MRLRLVVKSAIACALLSSVIWVAVANPTAALAAPIVDRLEAPCA